MSAEAYRENLVEARRELDAANAKMRRLVAAGTVVWGKLPKRDDEGWLVKGGRDGDADRAYSEWARCDSNVRHWSRLLSEAQQVRKGAAADAPAVQHPTEHTPPPPSETARLDDLNAQFAEKFGVEAAEAAKRAGAESRAAFEREEQERAARAAARTAEMLGEKPDDDDPIPF